MTPIIAESPTQHAPFLVTAKEAGRLLCMKPYPIVQLCEAGELKYTKIPDGNGEWHWAISVDSVREYAQRVTA